MSTCIAATGLPRFADATIGVGQFTVALLPGEAMLIPLEDGFAETCCTATDDAPDESETVAVIRYVPTVWYLCDADAPAVTVPSPKLITDLATLPDDPELEAVNVSAPLCDTFSETAGGWSPA